MAELFWKRVKKNRYGYLFLLPFLGFFFVFHIFPVGYSLFLSLHRWNGFSAMRYVGAAHFLKVIQTARFLNALKNVLYLWGVGTPLLVASALIGAAVLNSPTIRGRSFFRGVFFFPYVLMVVLVAAIFSLVLDTNYGLMNSLLNKIGIESIRWLDSTAWSKISVIIVTTWRWAGYWMIIFLAGLQGISPALYEAARIDGAGSLKLFWHITLPLIRPILFFVILMNSIGAFKAFATPYVLTGRTGEPIHSSETLVMYIYNVSFEYYTLGYASAACWIVFLMILGVSLIQLKYRRSR